MKKLTFALILTALLAGPAIGDQIVLCRKGDSWFASNVAPCPKGHRIVMVIKDDKLKRCYNLGFAGGSCKGLSGACKTECERGKEANELLRGL